jgi:hypothetical protein
MAAGGMPAEIRLSMSSERDSDGASLSIDFIDASDASITTSMPNERLAFDCAN